MIDTKSCTKDTVVRLSQSRKRRMLDWRLFGSWNGWFFFVQNEKNAVWGKFDSCTNRNYVLTDYVLSESVNLVCKSMRFDSGPEVFVRVNRNYVLTEYVLNENDCIWIEQYLAAESQTCSPDTPLPHRCFTSDVFRIYKAAEHNAIRLHSFFCSQARWGRTPIIDAAKNDDEALFELFADAGANVHASDCVRKTSFPL